MADIWEKQLKEVYGKFDESILLQMPMVFPRALDLMDDDNEGLCIELVEDMEQWLNSSLPIAAIDLKLFPAHLEYNTGAFNKEAHRYVQKAYDLDFTAAKSDDDGKCGLHFKRTYLAHKDKQLVGELSSIFCGEIAFVNTIAIRNDCVDLGVDYLLWRRFMNGIYDDYGNNNSSVTCVIYERWTDGEEPTRILKSNVGLRSTKYYYHRVVSVMA